MTALEFQKDLAAEVEKILKDIVTKDPDGNTIVGVKAYRQFLPKVTEDDEDETKFFPYAIIRLSEGTTPDDFTPWLFVLLGASIVFFIFITIREHYADSKRDRK